MNEMNLRVRDTQLMIIATSILGIPMAVSSTSIFNFFFLATDVKKQTNKRGMRKITKQRFKQDKSSDATPVNSLYAVGTLLFSVTQNKSDLLTL